MLKKLKCANCGTTKHHQWSSKNINEWYCGDCRRPEPINVYSYDGTKKFMSNWTRHQADIKARKALPDGTIGRFDPKGRRYA